MKTVSLFLLLLIPMACLAQSEPSAQSLSKKIEKQTGHPLNLGGKPAELTLPAGIALEDGLTEEEAIAIALWNHPALQAEMTAMGVARAEVVQAGLLTNPQLTMIFPFSFRILEGVANWPFEALWQRPRRVAAAKLEEERISETLVTRALDLVRDVRLGYADYAAARMRAGLAEELAGERREIATLVNARLRAGDISELETNASMSDARLAEDRAIRFAHEAALAKERLRGLLGYGAEDGPALNPVVPMPQLPAPAAQIISVQASTAPAVDPFNSPLAAFEPGPLAQLTKQAMEARPELKAGELAIEVAGARARWERTRILTVTAIAKEYGRGTNGFEQGPGLLVDLPIFNRNQGGISRAEAEIERAAKQLIAARQRVVSEVREAYTQLMQAREAHQLWRARVLPPLVEDIRLAENAYRSGDVSYLFVLETARRYSDERLREADYQATLGRAIAQLERSVGRRLIANH